MIQITAQMRVLVAIEPVDGRKGIDSLARLCQEKLAEDPFSGCVFVFRSRRGTSIRLITYDGQGYWLAQDRLIVRMFLVLGLRPGEMFALRWNDKQDHSLRIDTSISEGIEVETKTQGSDSAVWLPASIETELEWWRGATDSTPKAFIFPSTTGTAIGSKTS